MRIALVLNSLGAGGAERVMTLVADALVARGHEVTLVTLSLPGRDFFSVEPRVRRIALDLNRDSGTPLQAIGANLGRVRQIRRTLREIDPEVVLSFITSTNVLVSLACIGLGVRLVVSERVDPLMHSPGRIWGLLRLLAYPRADVLVAQTEQAAQWFRRRFGTRPRLLVIPNPVVVSTDSAPAHTPVVTPFLLAAGRLTPQKGFDV